MINLAWGGYPNGKLPVSALVQVTSKPDYMEASTAAAWFAMRQACYNATGKWINIAPGSSAYRDYNQQEYFWGLYRAGNGNVAAVPGTSNHGWGRAVDITGYEFDTVVWNWLQANAGSFGFSWQTGQASGERWHWESLNPPRLPSVSTSGSGATTLEDDLTPDQDQRLKNIEGFLYNGGVSTQQGWPGQPGTILRYAHDALTYAKAASDSLSRRVQRSKGAKATLLPDNGAQVAIEQIQDEADTNSIVRQLQADIALIKAALKIQ